MHNWCGQTVKSVTKSWRTTEANNHCAVMLTGVMSDNIAPKISAYTGQSGWALTLCNMLSVFHIYNAGWSILVRTGRHRINVGHRQPEFRCTELWHWWQWYHRIMIKLDSSILWLSQWCAEDTCTWTEKRWFLTEARLYEPTKSEGTWTACLKDHVPNQTSVPDEILKRNNEPNEKKKSNRPVLRQRLCRRGRRACTSTHRSNIQASVVCSPDVPLTRRHQTDLRRHQAAASWQRHVTACVAHTLVPPSCVRTVE